ncbi:MAG: hypothetical protein H8E66_00550 [Planctomycetes bacterium]|nr:hypothetical protein [Planctomycetota bacterium]
MKPTQCRFNQLVAVGLCSLLMTGPTRSAFSADEEIILPAPQPTVSAMLPAGLTRGTSIEVKVLGNSLAPATAVRVGGKGVAAEIVPLPEGKKPNAREVTVKLTAAADAELGIHELRLVTPGGTSNVVRFAASVLPEVTESEPNETAALAMRLDQLPVIVNGAVNRGEDRDCFRFSAKAGQQIILDLSGQRLHPYVTSQRPGWFEGLLTVREADEIGQAADATYLVEKSAAEKAAASKTTAAAVASSKAAADKAKAAKLAADKAVATKVAAAKTAANQLASATTAVGKANSGKAAAEKVATDKAIALKAATQQASLAQTAANKANADKIATDKVVAGKASIEKAAAERAAALTAAAFLLAFDDDRIAAERVAAQKAAASQTASDAAVAAKAAVETAAVEQVDAKRIAAEKAVAAAEEAAAEKANADKAVIEATAAAKAASRKVAAVTAIAKKAADDTTAAAQVAATKAAGAKTAIDKASEAKVAANKASADKVAADKAVAAKVAAATAAEKTVAAMKVAADNATAEQVAAEKVAANKAGVLKVASDKMAAAQAATKKAAEELAAANKLVSVKKDARDEIADKAYRNLAYSHDFAGRRDPLLVFDVPKDGQYVVEVRDELFRGRAEFNYRLTVGELPFVASAFPVGGKRGTTTPVSLEGINLGDVNKLSFAIPAEVPIEERHVERVSTPLGLSNDIALALGDDAELNEAEPNDVADKATVFQVPSVLNGVIEREGDIDNYKFQATKGQRLIFSTVSRSLGSPLDARLDLYDMNGRRLKNNDDANSTPDSLIDHMFAADGDYVIRVGDTTSLGSRRHVYRLDVHPPRPDFSLTVSPDNPRVTAGGTIALKVLVQRREGFTGNIELSAPNPPAGAVISPAVMSSSQSEQTLSVTMPADAASGVVAFSVVGKAKIGDQEITRKATPSEQVRYVNAWRYVPVDDLLLTVMPSAPLTLAWAQPDIKIISGKTVELPIKVQRAEGFTAPIRIVLQGLPSRVAAPPVTIEENATEAIVEIRSSNGAPANLANVVANGRVTFEGRSFIQSSPALRVQIEVPEKKN